MERNGDWRVKKQKARSEKIQEENLRIFREKEKSEESRGREQNERHQKKGKE